MKPTRYEPIGMRADENGNWINLVDYQRLELEIEPLKELNETYNRRLAEQRVRLGDKDKEIEQLKGERDAAIKEIGIWSQKCGRLEADNERLKDAKPKKGE